MINKVIMKNFRGVANGTIEGFDRLNIFVGKNNCGKSTILEALALSTDPGSFLPTILTRRGWAGLESVSSIFRYRDMDATILIETDTTSTKIVKHIPDMNTMNTMTSARHFSPNFASLAIDHSPPVPPGKMLFHADESGSFQRVIVKNFKQSHDVNFLDHIMETKRPRDAFNLAYQRGDAHHKKVLEVLQMVYPDVKNVLLFSEQVGLEVIFSNGKVPMFALGEGFKSAYIYLCLLLSNDNAIILCEEPENHHHPSSRKLIVHAIKEAIKNNQIFISTHSLELLDDILAICGKEGIKIFVTDFAQLNGALTYYEMNGDSAQLRRTLLESDLR